MECGGSFTLLAPIFEGSLKGPPLLQLLPKRKIPAAKRAKVIEGHPMLREAAVNAAQQWNFVESSADNRVAMLKFSFVILPDNSQVQSQTIFLPPAGIEIRQKPAAPAVEDQEGEFSPDQHPISKTRAGCLTSGWAPRLPKLLSSRSPAWAVQLAFMLWIPLNLEARVGIELKGTLKTRKLLTPLNAENAKNSEFA